MDTSERDRLRRDLTAARERLAMLRRLGLAVQQARKEAHEALNGGRGSGKPFTAVNRTRDAENALLSALLEDEG